MTNTPNFGTTWKEAIQSAYTYGYDCWEYSHAGVVDKARELLETEGEDAAYDYLMDMEWAITEGSESRAFWWGVDDFFAEQMSEEMNERYQREAAVAEDLHVAYEAGCHDAILGREWDLERVSHLHG